MENYSENNKKLILWIISSIIIISVAVGIYGYQYYAETMKKNL